MSIYQHDQDLKTAECRIKNEAYSEYQKTALFEFEDLLYSESLSTVSVLKHLTKANVIARSFPDTDIRNYTERDVIKIIGWIERKKWSDSTKVIYKVTLKKLLLFQKNKELADIVNIQ